jgi:hypothetical protein
VNAIHQYGQINSLRPKIGLSISNKQVLLKIQLGSLDYFNGHHLQGGDETTQTLLVGTLETRL